MHVNESLSAMQLILTQMAAAPTSGCLLIRTSNRIFNIHVLFEEAAGGGSVYMGVRPGSVLARQRFCSMSDPLLVLRLIER